MIKKDISIETLKSVGKLLLLVGETEYALEILRQKLCRLSAFEPYSAFRRIDRCNQGYITVKDLILFMQ